MSRRFIVAMLGLGLALILLPQVSLAVEDHLSRRRLSTQGKPFTMASRDMPMSWVLMPRRRSRTRKPVRRLRLILTRRKRSSI